MRTATFLKLAVITGLVIGIGFMVSTDTRAASDQIGSSVTIGTALTVTKGNDLVWGILAAPTSTSETWNINCGTGVLSGGLAANDLFSGDHNVGTFAINGQINGIITTSSTFTSFTDPALTLSNISVCAGTVLSSTGTMAVTIGGDLNITNAAVAGSYTDATITLTANYN
ncbi:MAG: DUF4402 domain-containing protein [candidate division Zixibacteria bacterium]|nr:DUF4402 domain-containing protein [candidate division Zixibacteria bacterium]